METVPEKRERLEKSLAEEKKLEQTIMNLGPEKNQVSLTSKKFFIALLRKRLIILNHFLTKMLNPSFFLSI